MLSRFTLIRQLAFWAPPRSRLRGAGAALIAVAIALLPSLVSAQRDERDLARAREAFRLANQLYEAGRFEQAAEEFERAYQLSQEVGLLHNIYLARRDLGDEEGAADALRRYLEAGAPGATEQARTLLEHRLEALERAIGQRAPAPAHGPDPNIDTPPAEAAASEGQPAADRTEEPPGAQESPSGAPTTEAAIEVGTSQTQEDTGSSGNVAEEWWFWTLLIGGAAIVATGISLGVVYGTNQSTTSSIDGDVFGQVLTLRWEL